MGINEDLRSFINKHKVEKGKPYTNTSIGSPKVSLYIPEESYEKFINLYSLALTSGMALHFTEKPTDYFKVSINYSKDILTSIYSIIYSLII